MRICIIGPGIMPIPPTGWGAVESLVWDLHNALIKLGHEVKIINNPNPMEVIAEVNGFSPDFVHIHYDNFIGIYDYIQYPKAITSHFGYLERPEMFGGYANIANAFRNIKPNVFCLSEGIKKVYKVLLDIPKERLYVTPNGVACSEFRHTTEPEFPDRSLYLAKVDYRKRQHLFQSIESLWYAGNIADDRFDQSKNYLGEWSKEILHDQLTEYGNLVLLSDGEAHSLVIMEAFASGLGVVVSQYATANLDLDREFITVITEDKIHDIDYVEKEIVKNREYSVAHREEILEYAKTFDWVNVIQNHYVPNVQKLIEQ
jgi:glycosyltransferase involved in cell wall biosynthesis|tara:strand:+ start:306 stop:1250 length:945 start_codon:yes stop_codon:yes gene_type:complete